VRKATNLFADPDFDGDPVQIYEPDSSEPPIPQDETTDEDETAGLDATDPPFPGDDEPFPDKPNIELGEDGYKPKKYYINDIPVSVAHERVQYYGANGKLITESLKDYTRKNIDKAFASLDEFIAKWNSTEKKEELVKELAEQGVLLEALREEVGQDMDAFDLICHVAFDQPALTRKERADQVRKRNYFAKYQGVARQVIDALLDKYENDGITTLESGATLKVDPLSKMGSPIELVRAFGKKTDFEKAIEELENEIYKTA
jgi:type I restriction enzyme R subunit